MNELEFTTEEVSLISEIINQKSVSIIWDINAFYFNTQQFTYKLECISDLPEGSNYEYDEIFYCRFEKLNEKVSFSSNDPKFWYKIISKEIKVDSIKIINIIQVFPKDFLIDISEISNYKKGLNKLSLGLIVETKEGSIPAFLLPSNHGFTWQTKYDFYSQAEVSELLTDKITKFKLRTV
ncbi:MAG: hypothetical protein ABJA66_09900 [Actinomycetota bacterium]